MNAKGRMELVTLLVELEMLRDGLQAILDVNEHKYNRMPEGLRESARGERQGEINDELDTAVINLEDCISCIEAVIE